MFGLPVMWTVAQKLGQVVKTGCSNPDEFWSWMAQNSPASKIFYDAMAEKARAQVQR
jgi:hypothetical protein